MSIVSWSSYAHAPNEAFFELFESDHKLVVKVEFPWTIRNALLEAMPKLNEADTKEQMDAGFHSYLQQNIQIKDINDQVFNLVRVQALPNSGHSHGSQFLLIYGPYKVVKSIRNTCMFNSYDDQKNYHTFSLPNMEVTEFVTTAQEPSYTQANMNSRLTMVWVYLVIGALGSLGAIVLLMKRMSQS